jgi:hypothetical protein
MGAAAAWALLRRHLLSESGVERAGLLRCAAVDAVLSADSRLALPAWLLQLFQVRGLFVRPCCAVHVALLLKSLPDASTPSLPSHAPGPTFLDAP